MSAPLKKVLGIDPGTGRMGWAILSGNQVAQRLDAYGCIETPAHTEQHLRLRLLYQEVTNIIKEHKPTEAAVEDLFFFKNAKTVMKVAEARGAIITAIMNSDISVQSYTPLQIKQTVAGYGRADKRQVQQMVKSILKLKIVPRPDDAADAVAVGLTHLFTNQALT